MSGSGFSGAVDALVAAFTTAAPSTVQVIDGDPYDPAKVNFLAVGWDRSEAPAVTRNTSGSADMAEARQDEEIDVSNLLVVHDGNKTPAQIRSDANTLLNTFDAALAADRTLGQRVLKARITDYEYTPVEVGDGSGGALRFTVNVRAWK